MDKLVRDRIKEIIEKKGEKAIGYIASEEEYKSFLAKKLVEESEEFLAQPSIEELADLLEVIDNVYDAFKYRKEEVFYVKNEKRKCRGGFTKRFILERVEKE